MYKFEYQTRVLGPLVTPAAKLNRVQEDLDRLRTTQSRTIAEAEFLGVLEQLEQELIQNHTTAELTWDQEAQRAAFIKSLAKLSAVQLVSQGRVDVDTMMQMASLSPADQAQCVRYSTIFATNINNATKEAEQTVTPQDIVPEHLLK